MLQDWPASLQALLDIFHIFQQKKEENLTSFKYCKGYSNGK